ncbi:hypothetical protein U1Q18_008089, partial [Sarracenia purpurea var. burkii]
SSSIIQLTHPTIEPTFRPIHPAPDSPHHIAPLKLAVALATLAIVAASSNVALAPPTQGAPLPVLPELSYMPEIPLVDFLVDAPSDAPYAPTVDVIFA